MRNLSYQLYGFIHIRDTIFTTVDSPQDYHPQLLLMRVFNVVIIRFEIAMSDVELKRASRANFGQ